MGIKHTVFKILFESIPSLLITPLEDLLMLVSRQKKSSNSRKARTYDLMNVQSSSRFVTLDGLVLHNCLGLSYLMSKYGLAAKLSLDTKRHWTEDEAQDMIDTFYDSFWKLKDYQDDLRAYYEEGNELVLPDGWTMWADNDNFRSSGNMPIQGKGAVALRRAEVACMKKGIYLPFSLHDAIYIMGKVGEEKQILEAREEMRKSFISIFPKHLQEYAGKIRSDIKLWGPDYKDGQEIKIGKEVLVAKTLHIDQRAESDYKKFSKYFESRIEDTL